MQTQLKYIKSEIINAFLERQIIWFIGLIFVFHLILRLLNIPGAVFFLIAIPIIFACINLVGFIIKRINTHHWNFDYIILSLLYLLPAIKLLFTYYNFFFHLFLIVFGITIIVYKKAPVINLRKRLTLLLVINLFVLLIPAKMLLNYTRSIDDKTWGNKIKWTDFQGEEPANNEKYAAMINSKFYYKYNRCFNTPRVLTITVMSKSNSWASAIFAKYNTNNLLNHEKIHFDISEWTRREFKDSIDNVDRISEKNISEIYKHFKELKEIRQVNYDTDSDHGKNPEGQKKWDEKLFKYLNK